MIQVTGQEAMDTPNVIKEEIDPQLIESLFTNYTSASEALLEIIDNSIDEKLQGRKVQIEIELRPNSIRVTDRGGLGMDLRGLEQFFRWGRSHKSGRGGKMGRYGQGGKAAIGFLGRSFVLVAKAASDSCAHKISDDSWDVRSTGTKTWVVDRVKVPVPDEEGYVQLSISHLRGRRIHKDALKAKLGDTYRELILKGFCQVTVNGEPVPLLELPLYEKYPKQQVDAPLTVGGRVRGWFGRLKADVSKQGRLKGGIRCTVNGRLIRAEEFFGHPTPQSKQSLNQLIGVIEIPSVPLNMNKTDFNRDSEAWEEVRQLMFRRLEPLVRELRGAHEHEKVSETDRKQVRAAWDLFQSAITRLEWRYKLSERFNTASGQRPGGSTTQASNGKSRPRATRSDLGGKHRPASPAPDDAEGRRKRLGHIPWEPRSIPNDRTRSMMATDSGSPVVCINTRYRLYKETKGALWYIVETGVLESAKYERDEQLTPDKYLDEVNEILSEAFSATGD